MGRGSGIIAGYGAFSKRRKELEEQAARRRQQDVSLYKTLIGAGYQPEGGIAGWQAPQSVGDSIRLLVSQMKGGGGRPSLRVDSTGKMGVASGP